MCNRSKAISRSLFSRRPYCSSAACCATERGARFSCAIGASFGRAGARFSWLMAQSHSCQYHANVHFNFSRSLRSPCPMRERASRGTEWLQLALLMPPPPTASPQRLHLFAFAVASPPAPFSRLPHSPSLQIRSTPASATISSSISVYTFCLYSLIPVFSGNLILNWNWLVMICITTCTVIKIKICILTDTY